MDQFIFIAAIVTDLVSTARDTGREFGVNWPHFISQCLSFLIVAGLLYKFAYGPILKVLEERRERIAESLANAEKIKQELASAQAKAQEILQQAGSEANRIIEEARSVGQKEIEKASQQAIATANEIIARAKQASEAELVRMKADLRSEVGRLVVETTAKVTGKILTSEDQQRLAEETNRELAA